MDTLIIFDDVRGLGFIRITGSTADIFFHVSDVTDKALTVGDHVEFTIGEGRKGQQAKNIHRIPAPPNQSA